MMFHSPTFCQEVKPKLSRQKTVDVEQKQPESVILPNGATVDEVVRGLRALGVSARDTISILQAIKSAGALNADLEMQ